MRGFCCLLLSLFVVSTTLGQEGCINSSYTTHVVQYSNSVRMECAMYDSYRWWQSEDGCRRFSPYSPCDGRQLCMVRIDENRGRYLYYCCTENVAELNSTTRKTCFEIDICTNVIGSSVPPFAFFGQQQRVYVEMYAEPQPSTHSPLVYVVEDSGNFTPVDLLEVDILRNSSAPLLTWVYLLNIPDIPSADSATLEFFVTYSTAHATCLGIRRSVQLNVPVVRRAVTPPSTGAVTPPSTGAVTPPSTGAEDRPSSTASSNASNPAAPTTEAVGERLAPSSEGCVIGFSVTIAILIVGCVVSNVLVGFTCRHITQKMEHNKQLASSEQTPSPGRPKSLLAGLPYRQLKASGSATPTPVTPMTLRTLVDKESAEREPSPHSHHAVQEQATETNYNSQHP